MQKGYKMLSEDFVPILYNEITKKAKIDEIDVLTEVKAVETSLAELDLKTARLPFSEKTIGDLVKFTAGKGYYSDRVELAWSSKGNFERFVINRKEHGAPDTDYKQIAVTEGNEAQNDYYYNDVNAVL